MFNDKENSRRHDGNYNHPENEVFLKRLIKWGNDNFRDYSWRKERTPYRVFIAEILLQRTNADQVEPVYTDFLKKFPTISSIINGSPKSIEKTIESLGLLKRVNVIVDSAK
ncbi:MAG: hypothetical protein GF364_15595 [Candidatus Lokiarchaeota archaeon]|nr:hypothetical protein [Candidatus Lokiarchaeota archaeon]